MMALLGAGSSTAAAMLSAASTMLAGEPSGLALDFTDNFWFASTGLNGSAKVKDTGTHENNYDSTPDGLRITSTAISYTGSPPSGADITYPTTLRSTGPDFTTMSIIATFLDAGSTFKAGVSVGGGSGELTAWNGILGASVPVGLSGACRLVNVLVVPRAMTSSELVAGTTS